MEEGSVWCTRAALFLHCRSVTKAAVMLGLLQCCFALVREIFWTCSMDFSTQYRLESVLKHRGRDEARRMVSILLKNL